MARPGGRLKVHPFARRRRLRGHGDRDRGRKGPEPRVGAEPQPPWYQLRERLEHVVGQRAEIVFENLSRRSSVSRSNTPGGNVVSSFARRSNPWSDVNRLNTFPGNTAMSLTCSSSSVSAVSRLNHSAGSAAMSLPFQLELGERGDVVEQIARQVVECVAGEIERKQAGETLEVPLFSEPTSSPETSSVSIWARSEEVTSSQETLGAGTARWMASSTLGW